MHRFPVPARARVRSAWWLGNLQCLSPAGAEAEDGKGRGGDGIAGDEMALGLDFSANELRRGALKIVHVPRRLPWILHVLHGKRRSHRWVIGSSPIDKTLSLADYFPARDALTSHLNELAVLVVDAAPSTAVLKWFAVSNNELID